MCLPIATWQAAVAVLLMKADLMFPEGHGAPRAFTRDGTAAKKTNELLENASAAVDKLFEQRGYDPKKPEQLKASLGYALDRYEAAAYLFTGRVASAAALAAGGASHRQADRQRDRARDRMRSCRCASNTGSGMSV